MRRNPWWFYAVLGVMTLVVAGLGWKTVSAVRHPAPQPPDAKVRLTVLPEDSTAAAHYLNDIIGETHRVQIEDANMICQAVTGTNFSVQRWGLVIAGDRLIHADMASDTRNQLEEIIKFGMRNERWELRRCAIESIDGSPLIQRKDFADIVRSMRNDPQEEVKVRATAALTGP